MSSATDKTVTVSFDPTALQKQTDIIGPATPTSAGVMPASLAARLAQLPTFKIFTAITTNGVPTVIGTIPAHGDGAYISLTQTVASTPGGVDAGSFVLQNFSYIVSGGVVVNSVGLTPIFAAASNGVGGAFAVTPTANGGNIDIVVTGFAGKTVSWRVAVMSTSITP